MRGGILIFDVADVWDVSRRGGTRLPQRSYAKTVTHQMNGVLAFTTSLTGVYKRYTVVLATAIKVRTIEAPPRSGEILGIQAALIAPIKPEFPTTWFLPAGIPCRGMRCCVASPLPC